jgi:transcription initiation factor TFIID TATA-box-binding protein
MKIVNIVATVTLSSPLDLSYLIKYLPGSKFADVGAKGLQFRLQPENYYISFYKSGKFVITGVKSQEAIASIAHRIVKILNKYQKGTKITSTCIHNIVIVDNLFQNINIEYLIGSLPQDTNVDYEPEQFSGLIYKEKNLTFMLFKSGKIIMTGIKDFHSIKPSLIAFKKKIKIALS